MSDRTIGILGLGIFGSSVLAALATVGVTANLTPELGKLALSIVMVLMFIGRIGPLTLLVSLADYQPDKKDLIQYMKADISIG